MYNWQRLETKRFQTEDPTSEILIAAVNDKSHFLNRSKRAQSLRASAPANGNNAGRDAAEGSADRSASMRCAAAAKLFRSRSAESAGVLKRLRGAAYARSRIPEEYSLMHFYRGRRRCWRIDRRGRRLRRRASWRSPRDLFRRPNKYTAHQNFRSKETTSNKHQKNRPTITQKQQIYMKIISIK